MLKHRVWQISKSFFCNVYLHPNIIHNCVFVVASSRLNVFITSPEPVYLSQSLSLLTFENTNRPKIQTGSLVRQISNLSHKQTHSMWNVGGCIVCVLRCSFLYSLLPQSVYSFWPEHKIIKTQEYLYLFSHFQNTQPRTVLLPFTGIRVLTAGRLYIIARGMVQQLELLSKQW